MRPISKRESGGLSNMTERKPPSTADVTVLLNAWGEGNQSAQEVLWPIVFGELKRLARRHLARERPDHTLQSGALVNEAYIRLVDCNNTKWQNRAHFFALCARMMRHILIDHARAHRRQKRRSQGKVLLDDVVLVSESTAEQLLVLDDALKRLAAIHPRKSDVVEMRFFGGLSVEETAEVLKVSRLTVIRDWNFARAWLRATISGENFDEP
jgi:RNA polymerase sigma factor (TIGR02999 family)